MSDTEGMVRVMEHAAESARAAAAKLRAIPTNHGSTEQQVYAEAIAALAYARGVLQMVAASVSPEGRSLVDDLVSHLFEGDDTVGYAQWAERNDGVAMSDGELADVGRYLRSLRVGERS
jgi:hypothetical protein